MINVICDRESWAELRGRFPEQQRFSKPDEYDQYLVSLCGRPLLVRVGDFQSGFDIHVYPPHSRDNRP